MRKGGKGKKKQQANTSDDAAAQPKIPAEAAPGSSAEALDADVTSQVDFGSDGEQVATPEDENDEQSQAEAEGDNSDTEGESTVSRREAKPPRRPTAYAIPRRSAEQKLRDMVRSWTLSQCKDVVDLGKDPDLVRMCKERVDNSEHTPLDPTRLNQVATNLSGMHGYHRHPIEGIVQAPVWDNNPQTFLEQFVLYKTRGGVLAWHSLITNEGQRKYLITTTDGLEPHSTDDEFIRVMRTKFEVRPHATALQAVERADYTTIKDAQSYQRLASSLFEHALRTADADAASQKQMINAFITRLPCWSLAGTLLRKSHKTFKALLMDVGAVEEHFARMEQLNSSCEVAASLKMLTPCADYDHVARSRLSIKVSRVAPRKTAHKANTSEGAKANNKRKARSNARSRAKRQKDGNGEQVATADDCPHCMEQGRKPSYNTKHTEDQCWLKHPELRPKTTSKVCDTQAMHTLRTNSVAGAQKYTQLAGQEMVPANRVNGPVAQYKATIAATEVGPGTEVSVLVDTGAAVSVCSQTIYETLLKQGAQSSSIPIKCITAAGHEILLNKQVTAALTVALAGAQTTIPLTMCALDTKGQDIIISNHVAQDAKLLEMHITDLHSHQGNTIFSREYGRDADDAFELEQVTSLEAVPVDIPVTVETDKLDQTQLQLAVACALVEAHTHSETSVIDPASHDASADKQHPPIELPKIDTGDTKFDEQLRQIVQKHKELFSAKLHPHGMDAPECYIRVKPGSKMKHAPYPRANAKKRGVIDKVLTKMLQDKVIERVSSPICSSPALLVQKNDRTDENNKHRLVANFKWLNEVAETYSYPLPNTADLLQSVGKYKFKAKLDCSHGYWQLKLEPESRKWTAFRTHRGTYQYKKCPMGFKCSAAFFQRAMEHVLGDYIESICWAYQDDLLVVGNTKDELARNLEAVLQRLQDHNVRLKPSKTQLGLTELEFLGHKLTPEGTLPTDRYKAGLLNVKPPTSTSSARS